MDDSAFPRAAIVLAAGLGLRMRPVTEHLPKPLVKVAGKCLVDYALDFVEGAGVEHAVVNASYKAEMLEAHLRGRTHPRILLSREEAPLETGGGIREALPHLGALPFLSVNSDIICISGPRHAGLRLRDAWDDARMDALLLLHPLERALGFEGAGDFFLDGAGRLTRRGAQARAPYVFAGVQLLHPRFFTGCPARGAFSLNLLYNRGLQPDGTLARVAGLVHDGDWLHVGDPAGLRAGEAYFNR